MAVRSPVASRPKTRDVFARGPVLAVAAAMVAGLLLVSAAYGFHRDELYFIVAGRHPAFGYADQPPFTPLVSAAMTQLLGLSPIAIRILPAFAMGLAAVLAALMARDLGGGRAAQTVAAAAIAASGFLAAGHLDHTTTYDLLATTVVLWLVVKLLAGADPRLWLGVGLAAGIGLQNKFSVVLFGASLIIGFVLTRRWDVFRSPWAWLGVAIAALIWLPNLAWQVANGWPQFEMARAIAREAAENRTLFLPLQVIFAGLFLAPVLIAGIAWLLARPAGRPWRALAWGYLALVVIYLATAGKGYYAIGYFAALFAAGAIVTEGWLGRGRRALRRGILVVAIVASAIFISVMTLPIIPIDVVGSTPIPEIYTESAEQVGWPQLADAVADAADSLPPDERALAVVFASNYAAAGASELLGAARKMPPVYSGHNSYWEWGPPPEVDGPVILVGWHGTYLPPGFRDCRLVGAVDNGVRVENEDQGDAIQVCGGRTGTWAEMWPHARHLD